MGARGHGRNDLTKDWADDRQTGTEYCAVELDDGPDTSVCVVPSRIITNRSLSEERDSYD